MQIIFHRDIDEQIKDKYLVLELETFEVEGKLLETFCVVPPESVPLNEIPLLDKHTALHSEFIKNLKIKNYQFCVAAAEHLTGKFGGELDSFYAIVVGRAQQEPTEQ